MTAIVETQPRGMLIVGANVAGGRAAETLRKLGFAGRVTLVGAEPQHPYERPPLSKAVLQGTMKPEQLHLRPLEFYAEQNIELKTGTPATKLDVSARSVDLASGERIAFDTLLIATGARPVKPAIPGANLRGVYYLRTVDDAQRLRSVMQPGARAVILGGGFIGAEVAASCRAAGVDVTLIEAASTPMGKALGEEIGQVLADLHRARGVSVRTGVSIQELRGLSGQVQEAVTTSGDVLSCDFVVIGIGATPEVEWLQDSGVELENGVRVNEFCETSIPGIFAAGDAANAFNPLFGEHMRVEHSENAQNQGIAAAKNMLGQHVPFAEVPYFWSDQYDLRIQFVGHNREWDRVVIRGSTKAPSFLAYYLAGDLLQGALGVNNFKGINAAKRLIRERARVDAAQLADEQAEIRALETARG